MIGLAPRPTGNRRLVLEGASAAQRNIKNVSNNLNKKSRCLPFCTQRKFQGVEVKPLPRKGNAVHKNQVASSVINLTRHWFREHRTCRQNNAERVVTAAPEVNEY